MNKEKDIYQQKVEARISELEAGIDQIKAKADQAKAEAKVEYLNLLEELREKRARLCKRFVELKEAGEDAWEKFRSGVENALKSLENALS